MKGVVLVALRGVHYFLVMAFVYCLLHGVYSYMVLPQGNERTDSLYGSIVYGLCLCLYLTLVWMGKRVCEWTMSPES